ncbi:MAG: hypothetical protein IJ673_02340, partial [Treponema sp.]|nr:hypothetical protein [Treponema sp.]
MKKITLSIAALAMAAAFTTGFVSCNDKKADNNAPAADAASAATTETVAEPAATEAAAPAENPLISRKIEGIYINANDLEKAVLTAPLVDEVSGFTLNASEEK